MDNLDQKNIPILQEKKPGNSVICNLQLSRSITKLPVTKSLNLETIRQKDETEDYEEIRRIISLISPRNPQNYNLRNIPIARSPPLRNNIKRSSNFTYQMRLRKSLSPIITKSQEKKELKFQKGFNIHGQVIVKGKSIGKYTSLA